MTEYFYGIGGDLRLAKVNGVATKAPVNTPVGSVGSFVASGQFEYEFHDWNGSSRVTVSASGSVIKTFQSDAFGAGSNAATDDVAQVNALDVDAYSAHAGARDYYPSFGVWNIPDPFHGSYDFTDPQSLNRYAYVGNSPVSYNDPSGLARSGNLWEGDGYTSNTSASWGSGDWYSTKPGGECKLCVWNLIPGLLRQGASLIGSFLAANGGSSCPSGFMCANTNSNPLDTQQQNDALQRKAQQQTYGKQADGSYRADPVKLAATVAAKKPYYEPGGDGKAECAALCKFLSGAPATPQWKQGRHALELSHVSYLKCHYNPS